MIWITRVNLLNVWNEKKNIWMVSDDFIYGTQLSASGTFPSSVRTNGMWILFWIHFKELSWIYIKKKKKSSDANKFNFTNVFEHYVRASPLYLDMGINPFNKGRHRETIKSSQLGVICVTLDCTSNHLSNETQTHTQMWDKSTGSGTRKRSLLCRSSRR